MIEKLILGTAGLGGLPYGRNKREVNTEDAIALIKHAWDAGIRTFDTAPTYGQAENIIGHVLKCNNLSARIFTKTRGDVAEAAQSIQHLLRGDPKRADVVFLYHNWTRHIGWPANWIRGASIYFEHDDSDSATAAFIHFDYIQHEWNILRRCYAPYPYRYGPEARAPKQTRIARSALLQGVLAGEECPNDTLKQRVQAAEKVAAAFGVNLKTLALRSGLENETTDMVIIGPTTISELDECLEIAKREPLGTERYVPMLDMGVCTDNDPRTWA